MKNPYFIARPRHGISINGKSWLLDSKGEPMEFDSLMSAIDYLKDNGYSHLTNVEIQDEFFIQQDFK